jgi:hypothetical protein
MKILSSWLGSGKGGLPRSWIAALALAALGLVLYLGFVQPAEQDLAALERRVAILKAKSILAETTNPLNQGRQLVAFYRQFPDRESTPDWLGKIQTVAQTHQLQLLRGEYRLMDDTSGRLARYQITLPLRGTYPEIRGFIKDVLFEVPAAALDNISFERQKIGDSSVQATVRLTLYLRLT